MEFPNLIKYYSTIGNGTLLKEEYTTMENCTLFKDINILLYHTLILCSKAFYTTIGQFPTPYDFLAIAPKDISLWEYYLGCPNKCVKPKIF